MVEAVDSIDLRLGALSGNGWKAEGAGLRLGWDEEERAIFSLSADRIDHPFIPFPLIGPRLDCSEGTINERNVECDKGLVRLKTALLDKDRFSASFSWTPETNDFRLRLTDLKIAGGRGSLLLEGNHRSWRAEIKGSRLSLQELSKGLATLGIAPPPFEFSGKGDLTLSLKGGASEIRDQGWRIDFDDLTFAEESGSYLGEGLRGSWQGRLGRGTEGFNGSQHLRLQEGAILTPAVYLAPEGREIAIDSDLRANEAWSELQLTGITYRHQGLLGFQADARFKLEPRIKLSNLILRSQPIDLEPFYETYLQPVLADNFFQELRISGRLEANLEMDSANSVQLKLRDVAVDQGEDESGQTGGNFSLRGLAGELNWHSTGRSPVSRLSWSGGSLLGGLTLGPGQVSPQLTAKQIILDRPFSLPVLDGELRTEAFRLESLDSGPRLEFRGYLTPISMQRLSEAIGWPALAGQLSGMIPAVSFEEGSLRVEGVMLIRLFGGRTLVKNLNLTDLFGPLPVLEADLELKDIDLETLTRTFSFGKITGKLEGQVENLRLEAWQPISFEAGFNTPAEDGSRHRISQRAVDNISNLGGAGISGALSRSFLRVFEEFGYDRLGINCRLTQGVCEMGGIEAAERGYYLVKGGGIPRIDIIGFNRRTDWGLLLSKLQQMTEGEAPVIE